MAITAPSGGWLGLALKAGAVIVLIAVIVFFFGGPFINFWKGQAEKWKGREETAQDNLQGRQLEQKADQVLDAKVDQVHERVIERNNTIVEYREKARGAVDAKTPLGGDRERRVREHDVSLCEQRPSVCGGGQGPAGDDAGIRAPGLPAPVSGD